MTALALDPKVDLTDAKSIQLGDEQFLVARLMLRQTSRIHPVMPRLLQVINRRAAAFSDAAKKEAERAAADPSGAGAVLSRLTPAENVDFLRDTTLSEEETTLAVSAVAAGLSRTYPGITEQALYDMPIDAGQLIAAITVVVMQTRAVRAALPGEDVGEATATRSTGTASSQNSAST